VGLSSLLILGGAKEGLNRYLFIGGDVFCFGIGAKYVPIPK
jgi:hypothetical protein